MRLSLPKQLPAPVRVGTSVLRQPFVHAPVLCVLLYLLAQAFGFSSYHTYVLTTLAVYGVASLGLNLPVGYSGVIAIGNGAAFFTGTYCVAILSGLHGQPLWISLTLAVLIGGGIGFLMSVPAVRLGGLALAMISLGFVLILADVVRILSSITNGFSGISGIVAHWGFGSGATPLSQGALTALVLVVLGLAYLTNWYFRASRIGRISVAAKNDAVGAEALGIKVFATQIATFVAGAAVGAAAGGLNGYLVGFISPDSITIDTSFLFLIMVVFGGSGTRIGPVLGTIVIGGTPIWLAKYPNLSVIIYGALLLIVVLFRPRGVVSRTGLQVPNAVGRILGTSVTPSSELSAADVASLEVRRGRSASSPFVVSCSDVHKRFGGLHALRGVSMSMGQGEVVAIVGPNGSGKTTFLNAITGQFGIDSGAIDVRGTKVAASRRRFLARNYVARTFQTPRHFGDMSAGEVMLLASQRPVRRPGAVDVARLRVLALELLDSAGIDITTSHETSGLSHGQLRFLEIASALVRGPQLLIFDEPATGLGLSEIAHLQQAIEGASAAGCAVLLVEHHLQLVRDTSDRVLVFNTGEVLWEGPPANIGEVDSVRHAYLGMAV